MDSVANGIGRRVPDDARAVDREITRGVAPLIGGWVQLFCLLLLCLIGLVAEGLYPTDGGSFLILKFGDGLFSQTLRSSWILARANLASHSWIFF